MPWAGRERRRSPADRVSEMPSWGEVEAEAPELAVVRLGDPPDHLIIESWHAGRGVERHVRR
jgi:hypothetical protein